MWPSTTFLALLASAVLPVSVLAEHGLQARGHHAAIAKRAENGTHLDKRISNARFTYFAVGMGACGQFSHPGDFMVALNSAQYGGGYPGPNCFKKISISYGGKSTTATILDECPGCPYGGLDLSQGLFEFFAPTSAGVINGEWSFEGGGGGGDDNAAPATHKKPDPPAPTPTPDPPKTEAARVQVKSKTSTKTSSTSKSKSKASSTKASTKISTSKVSSSSASASAVNYHKGNAGNLAIPTGTPSDDASYVAGGLNLLEEVLIQFGGLIVTGGNSA